ncbi:hypothetical protein ACQUY5_24205 [Bacillus cereus]|uniref:hypothetical protein n=1 Tax=Bacillus cereus TaxID=1396 RepID=UPI003D1751AC
MFKSFNNKGFELNFENGVSISVQWGYSNYCAVRDVERKHNDSMETAEHVSETAEILIMRGEDCLSQKFADQFELECDGQYIGWVSADTVAFAIEWAKNYATHNKNGVRGILEQIAEVDDHTRLLNYKEKDDEITKKLYEGLVSGNLGISEEQLKSFSQHILVERGNEQGEPRMIMEVDRNNQQSKFKPIRELDPTQYSVANPLELKYYYDYTTFPTHGRIILGEYQYTDNSTAILDFELEENDSVGTLILMDVNKQKRNEFQVNLDSDVRLIITKIELVGYDLLVYLNVEGKEEDEKVVFPLDRMLLKRILICMTTEQ